MNDANQPVDAGQMIVDAIRMCTPVELTILGDASRHHRDTAADYGRGALAEFWAVLAVAADVVLAAHPDAVTARDRAELDSFGENDGEPK